MQSLELLRQPLERESVQLLYQTGLKKTKEIANNDLIDKQLQLAKSIDNKAFEHLELDEMWSFLLQKIFKLWIWVAICKKTKLILGFVVGNRGAKTGKKLYETIQPYVNNQTTYYTDYWEPYTKFLPTNQHIQSKKYTYTIEGYNSNFRQFVSSLRRKTKCYSKSKEGATSRKTNFIYNHNQQKLNKLSI